jgi:DNA-binding CsgD family transcriptional regulator
VAHRLGTQLVTSVSIDDLLAGLTSDIGESMRLESVTVVGDTLTAVRWGEPSVPGTEVELRHRGEPVGLLQVPAARRTAVHARPHDPARARVGRRRRRHRPRCRGSRGDAPPAGRRPSRRAAGAPARDPRRPRTAVRGPFPELSDRVREVLDLLARGYDNATIARRMVLSPKTVRNHVSNVLTKLGIPDRAQAMIKARDEGLGAS